MKQLGTLFTTWKLPGPDNPGLPDLSTISPPCFVRTQKNTASAQTNSDRLNSGTTLQGNTHTHGYWSGLCSPSSEDCQSSYYSTGYGTAALLPLLSTIQRVTSTACIQDKPETGLNPPRHPTPSRKPATPRYQSISGSYRVLGR